MATMLSSSTKQINTYGKRSKRVVDAPHSTRGPAPNSIISIFDDLPPPPALSSLASRMKKRENIDALSSPNSIAKQRKKKRLSATLSPRKPSRVTQNATPSILPTPGPKLKASASSSTNARPDPSTRKPLSRLPVNLPGSPTLPTIMQAGTKPRKPLAKLASIKPPKPSKSVINVDIIVLDTDGKTIRKERRVSRTGVDTNPVTTMAIPTPRSPISKPDIDRHDGSFSQPAQPKLSRRPKSTVLLSDASDSEPEILQAQPKAKIDVAGASLKSKTKQRTIMDSVVIPPAPYRASVAHALPSAHKAPVTPPRYRPIQPIARPQPAFTLASSPVYKARQLTPIKGSRRKGLFEPPSPPSPSLTDYDLSLDLEELDLDAAYPTAEELVQDETPAYLRPLLEECGQDQCGPHDFSSFVEFFPFDPILQSGSTEESDALEFRKIGEASYSEVFGIGDVVLKIIPLRDEGVDHMGSQQTASSRAVAAEYEGPLPSDAHDVHKEIVVTRAMGEVCGGFVKLLKTYIVKGKYPEVLLNLWDDYNERKGSESVRPDAFKLSQLYAIVVLPNGGPDLEAYSFVNPGKSGWRQACSIFWQVAKSLAHAEHLVSFEHRDLHWGQILIKNVSFHNGKSRRNRAFMDDLAQGVQAMIIDLGLSRMDAGDGSRAPVHWTPLDDEVFMGEGDYQFDVYRMMRTHTVDAWEDYHPLTNVMWLHYLATKLLNAKGLRAPAVRKSKAATEGGLQSNSVEAFTEKDCYDSLLDVERWLGNTLTEAFPSQSKAIVKSKGRRKTVAPRHAVVSDGPASAVDVVGYGTEKGWISALN